MIEVDVAQLHVRYPRSHGQRYGDTVEVAAAGVEDVAYEINRLSFQDLAFSLILRSWGILMLTMISRSERPTTCSPPVPPFVDDITFLLRSFPKSPPRRCLCYLAAVSFRAECLVNMCSIAMDTCIAITYSKLNLHAKTVSSNPPMLESIQQLATPPPLTLSPSPPLLVYIDWNTFSSQVVYYVSYVSRELVAGSAKVTDVEPRCTAASRANLVIIHGRK